jgi:DNA gyrase subunit A
VVLNQLYSYTQLQDSFSINFLALVNGQPKILGLREALDHYLNFQIEIVERRTRFDLRKAEERAHILLGLKIAITHLDEVVELIKGSANPIVAKEGLIRRFELSEIQAQTILDMRLQRLTGLERDKINSDYHEIIEKITWLKQVLADDHLVVRIIREELTKIREEYGDGRRTEIIDAPDEILPEDLIAPEEMVVTVSHSGYIKRNPINLYRAQRRGGKGIKGMVTLDDDFVTSLYTASSLDTFLFFTNKGRVFWRKVYELPLAGRTARGKAVINLLELGEGEKVAAILPVADLANMDDTVSVLTVTKLGRVKKTFISEYKRPLRKGKFGLTIRDDDEILSAAITSGDDEIILVTRKGLSIHFHENEVRAMGRLAAGVKGITLGDGDEVVGVAALQNDASILTVTENGYGKRTAVAEYPLQSRGGKGVFTIKTSERNGMVVGVLPVDDEDQVMLIANSGKIIRMPMNTVRIIGRNTQGVRLINLEENEVVVDMSMLAREEGVDGVEGMDDDFADEYDDE